MELPAASFSGLLDWVLASREEFGVPHTLAEIDGMDASLIPLLAPIAERDPSLSSNPRPATDKQLAEILGSAFDGKL
jgi:alcohol dehydrogenase class IV